MTKAELITKIAIKSDLTRIGGSRALEQILASISAALKAGEEVSLTGFGRFYVRDVAERKGINPATKEPLLLKAKKVPAFKPGQHFKDKFN
jgi:DNA-binding protein HU-beta